MNKMCCSNVACELPDDLPHFDLRAVLLCLPVLYCIEPERR